MKHNHYPLGKACQTSVGKRRKKTSSLALPTLFFYSALSACGNAIAGTQCDVSAPAPLATPASVQVSITPTALCQGTTAIPNAFAGLMLPLQDVVTVIGDTNGVHPQFANLLQNLTMYTRDNHMRIRIGNDTLSWTGTTSPMKDRIPALVNLANQANVSYILGVDVKSNKLETSTKPAIAALTNALPGNRIEALELGNEADLYKAADQPGGIWNYNLFATRFSEYANSVVPLNVGAYGGKVAAPVWAGTAGSFFSVVPAGTNALDLLLSNSDIAAKIGFVDMHTYHGANCGVAGVPVPAPGELLTPLAVTKRPTSFEARIKSAHDRNLPFLLSEWNSISCNGVAGVSDAFEAALWTVDGLFEWLKVGLDGAMLTSNNIAPYSPWRFTTTSAGDRMVKVGPTYYGLRMFLQATQNSAKRVNLTLTNMNQKNVKAWATVDDANVVRVVLINKDANFTDPIDVSLAGYRAPRTYELTAPSFNATSGLSYAGQTFDNTTDGNPVGSPTVPATAAIAPGHYSYTFNGVGAVLLEFAPQELSSLTPNEDAYVRGGTYASKNYGNDESLVVKDAADNFDRNAFLKFDLSSITGTITSAKLRLVPVVSNPGIVNNVSRVAPEAWSEATVTWNNQPTAGEMLTSLHVPAAFTPVEVDVTGAALAARNGNQPLSLRIASSMNYGPNGNVAYASKSHPNEGYRPVLIVTH